MLTKRAVALEPGEVFWRANGELHRFLWRNGTNICTTKLMRQSGRFVHPDESINTSDYVDVTEEVMIVVQMAAVTK